MSVSLVLTVLNEGQHIRRLLDSILTQTRKPDQVVVCDGGSSDKTLQIVHEYTCNLPMQIVQAPGTNISEGRNIAISTAKGDIIAVTDSGVRLDPSWLHHLMKQFEDENVVLAAGFYVADPETLFEIAMGATVLPSVEDVDPKRFLPSSRSVAFRKNAWEAVGGYPEWLKYSEDVVFDLRVRDKFGPFAFTPDAIVHFRPRTSLCAFARQYHNYAMGDGRAGLFPYIHLIRYFTYLILLPLGIVAAVMVGPWMWILGVLAGASYMRLPFLRLVRTWDGLSSAERVMAVLLIPVIRVVGDCSKMLGYPVGFWSRWLAR